MVSITGHPLSAQKLAAGYRLIGRNGYSFDATIDFLIQALKESARFSVDEYLDAVGLLVPERDLMPETTAPRRDPFSCIVRSLFTFRSSSLRKYSEDYRALRSAFTSGGSGQSAFVLWFRGWSDDTDPQDTQRTGH